MYIAICRKLTQDIMQDSALCLRKLPYKRFARLLATSCPRYLRAVANGLALHLASTCDDERKRVLRLARPI
jgi:hypothetical protein